MINVADSALRDKASTTLRTTINRIIRTYNLATPEQVNLGNTWYVAGGIEVDNIARIGDISRERAAIIVAHLSPQTSWKRNIQGARQLVTDGRADHCMSNNVARANAALVADDPWTTFGPTAHKTIRFAHNLLGDTSRVTVDVWAMRVAMGKGWGVNWRTGHDDGLDRILGRVGIYEAIETAYRRAAARLNVTPVACQATAWIVSRNGRAT